MWWQDLYRGAGPCEYDARKTLPSLRVIESLEVVVWREDDFLLSKTKRVYYVFLRPGNKLPFACAMEKLSEVGTMIARRECKPT